MITLRTLAGEFRRAPRFEYDKRPTDAAPDWVRAISREFDPDPLTREALDTAASLIEDGYNEPDEADTNDGALCQWLLDYNDSFALCDEVIRQGRFKDIRDLLSQAQESFYAATFYRLQELLQEHLDEIPACESCGDPLGPHEEDYCLACASDLGLNEEEEGDEE